MVEGCEGERNVAFSNSVSLLVTLAEVVSRGKSPKKTSQRFFRATDDLLLVHRKSFRGVFRVLWLASQTSNTTMFPSAAQVFSPFHFSSLFTYFFRDLESGKSEETLWHV